MKFGLPSSGCKTRPAKGQPAQLVASLATEAVTPAAMRRCAKVRAVGNAATKTIFVPGVESVGLLEDDGDLTRYRARAGRTRRGVRPRHAARGRSSNLGGPHFSLARPGATESRSSISDAPRARGCARGRPTPPEVAPHRTSIHAKVGRWQGESGATAEGNGGVGGLRTSDDVGERSSARTRPSKGGPC
jgi:hypothetical protein